MMATAPAASIDRRKFDSLQAGRAFAAQFVVLFHAPLIMVQHLDVQMRNRFIEAGHSGVDFFFVLSGFIMFMVHGPDIGNRQRAAGFAISRFTRIYPLFWIVFAVFLLGQVVVGQMDAALDGPWAFLRAAALLPFQGYPPVTVAWTLSHELLFYALLGLCIFFGKAGFIALALWWSGCAIAVVVALATGRAPAFPADFLLSAYNLLFLFGMVAAYWHLKIRPETAALLLVAGLAAFVLTVFADGIIPVAVRPVAYGLSSAAILAGIARIEAAGRLRVPRLLVFMGDASYSTYLFHSVAMIALAIVMKKLGLDLGPAFVFVLMVVAGTIGGVMLHILVEKPLLRTIRRRASPGSSAAQPSS